MEEIKKPKQEITNINENKIFLVTSVVSEENNKEYLLYSDGNLYERDNDGNLMKLDNVSPESKKMVKKIMENFKPGKTDVIEPEKINAPSKKEINVDYPEL